MVCHCFNCSYRQMLFTENEDSELHRLVLCKHAELRTIRKLVRTGNPDVQDAHFNTPLHLAAIHESNFEIVAELIKAGAQVEISNLYYNTPLHVAASHYNIKATELLLQSGADINARNVQGNTPLHLAVKCSVHRKLKGGFKMHEKLIVKKLIQAGADVNITNKSKETPLYRAVEMGDLDIVQELLKSGADTNICNADSTSCLHVALFKLRPNHRLLEELVRNGANITYRDNWFRTPLDLAVLRYLSDPLDRLITAMTLIRMAVLVHPDLSINMSLINEETVVNSLYEYHQLCASKVRQMKAFPITEGISLYDFALRGMNCTVFSCNKFVDQINSKALLALLKGDFDLYKDNIECHFPILYLKRVLMSFSLVSRNEINQREIRISNDEIWLICDYLKRTDILQLIKAAFEIV